MHENRAEEMVRQPKETLLGHIQGPLGSSDHSVQMAHSDTTSQVNGTLLFLNCITLLTWFKRM